MHTILDVRNLVKRYGSTVAVAGVTLAVNEGEVFGLLGPNGAGKTTLLSIVSSLLAPTQGEVHLLGQKLTRWRRHMRSSIGIVPQELAIYEDLTARENLTFFGRLYGVSGEELRRRVDRTLDTIGLADRQRDRVSTFSGGMKRRLNLGAALIHKPRLLLLDEPTTGVDPQSRNHIFEEVRRLNAERVTIIYTSHYMEEVQTLCSRIGIMDHGRLIACDTLQGLLRKLSGVVRFRVPQMTDYLRERVEKLPESELVAGDDNSYAIECKDVKTVLLQLVALLNEADVELTSLETEEPNLERVFLHLTGRGLRD